MLENLNLRARLWLALADGVTAATRATLLERHGSFEAAFDAFPGGFDGLVTPRLLKELGQLKATGIDRLWQRLKELHIRLAFLGDGAYYPALLSCIPDAPDVLFYRGLLQAHECRSVAIVGSRRETRYGRRVAHSIARDLSMQGVTVVSGLARGIDTAAHEGALEGKGPTIAVLGSGLVRLYPEENAALAKRIIEGGGAVISELPPTAEPKPFRFPIRNRIVSGLAQALLVVEARDKSGTLITVGHALEQGREVFAIPGEVDAPGSAVPLRMLREGATMCTCALDLMEDMGWETAHNAGQAASVANPLLEGQQLRIWQALEPEALSFDELLAQVTMDTADLNTHLTLMEMEGLIEALPGRIYGRAAR